MHVFSNSNIRNNFSDIFTVFDDRVSHLKILERKLVPQGDGLASRDLQPLAVVQTRPGHALTRLDINDGNADVVASVMNQKLSHLSSSCRFNLIRLAAIP